MCAFVCVLCSERKALYEQQKRDAKAVEAEYAVEGGADVGGAKSGTMSLARYQAMEGLREAERKKQKEDLKPIGSRGARVGEVNAAKVIIRDRLLMKNATVRKALKDIDEDATGTLSRDEVPTRAPHRARTRHRIRALFSLSVFPVCWSTGEQVPPGAKPLEVL